MSRSVTRRRMLAAISTVPVLAVTRSSLLAEQPLVSPGTIDARLAALDARSGGRLGVAILDTGNGARHGHRVTERFAMCSTFKFLAAAAVLAKVDRGEEKLDRRIIFAQSDIVTASPATSKHVGGDGMPLSDICEAAITLSDNTAGNLLLADIGGPAGLTAFARSIGDSVTRLDRIETELNEATPGDPRDTTTPEAMLANMQTLILGDRLSQQSREQLIAWLVANKTGGKRLRAGLPKDWRVGDKTGGGDHGTVNDIAVIWPARRAPVLVTSYFTESQLSDDERNAVHAEVGKIVADAIV